MSARRWFALLAGLMVACGKDATDPVPGEIVSIVISPVLDTLVSLQETVQLTATAYDGAGAAVSGASMSWSAVDPDVASVDADGIVTALQNGVTAIRATVGEIKGSAAIVVSQRAATLETTSGDLQAATVGMPLDSSIAITARDALGHLAAGVTVRFQPSGSGTAAPAQAVADAAGQVMTNWTLGVEAGTQELSVIGGDTALAVLTASAFADEPDSMYLEAGDQQIELASLPLPAPVRIKVVDRYGNGVPEVPLWFSLSSGSLDNGLDTGQVLTDLDGIAAVQWTLGASLGGLAGQALLPDSTVGAIVDLPGSPVSFSATAVAFAFGGVSPNPPVAGRSMTVNGMGFDPDPSGNAVTVDGMPATVTAGTQTSLTVTVPSFGCVPAQSRTIEVARGAQTLTTTATVNPENALALSVGGTAVLSDPADYCLQFLPAGGAQEYLVGLTATRRLQGEVAFTLTGDDGVNPPPAPVAPPAWLTAASAAGSTAHRELALRAWEESFFARGRIPVAGGAPAAAAIARAARIVGGAITVKVPNINTDPCNAYTSVSATILAEGPRAVIASDASLPSDPDSLAAITNAVQTLVTAFGGAIYEVATTYFGLPTDLDQNGRITVLFSNTVAQLGVNSFTSAVDLVDPATCPASNGGEVVYVGLPAAPSASQVVALLQAAPPDMAHDLTHLIQLGRRLVAGGIPMASWLGEGQAELGTEIVGMALRGDALRRDYGTGVVNADAEAVQFYQPRFDRLSYLFGWDGASGTVGDAPERCSLFGFGGSSIPCAGPYAPGAAWSFLRYVSDRIGALYQGGDAGFQQALIGLDPTQDGSALLETLAGVDFGRLMVDWAISLYADGRVAPVAAPALQLPSWDLLDIFEALPAVQRLSPQDVGFASFARSGSVVGGGTAYTRISTGSPHAALSVRAESATGGRLAGDLRPRLWVVRVK
ncbi:MAG TPA: Ig-like domain-containing protein [Gemmatimonadales bacterium]|nr:Ig-like domain-containing protein [Gemmatimonadales bacterium]